MKRYQDYVGYEFIGGSQDGELGDLDELGLELAEGDMWSIWSDTTPPVQETYVVIGRKLFFVGYGETLGDDGHHRSE